VQELVDHQVRSLRPGPRAGDGVVVGLLVPELRDQRGALDVGGAVEHPAHVAQVDEAHGRVVRRQGVRVHLRVRSLESMNPEGVSALVDALLAVPARRDHVQSEEQPRAYPRLFPSSQAPRWSNRRRGSLHLAASYRHSLAYVSPSSPHTGSHCFVQNSSHDEFPRSS